MSKAMDALDLIRDFMASTPPPSGRPAIDLINAAALLRDYITTTEAEREASAKGVKDIMAEIETALDTALHFKVNDTHNDTMLAYEEWRDKIISMVNWSLCLLSENQRQLGRDESAARIKELEEALEPKWISVEDKVPTDGTSVLCSGLDWGKGPSRHYEVASFDGHQFYRGREEGEISDLDECPYITHWMPLPAEPQAALSGARKVGA